MEGKGMEIKDTYMFTQTPRSPEYQRGFEDGYNVAKQRMADVIAIMQPVETQTFTCTASTFGKSE
jgi:hypothetical protein